MRKITTGERHRQKAEDGRFLFCAYLVLLAFEWLGLQNELPPLKAARFTTLLGYGLFAAVFARGLVAAAFKRPQGKIFIAFIALTVLSLAWAVVTQHAFNAIRPLVDYTIFFAITVALVDRPKRFRQLSWTMLAIVTALVIRNFANLGDPARATAFNAGPFLGDGNDFAWGMVIALPLIAYLSKVQRGALERSAGILGAALCVLAVVGTTSRGGSLGLAGSLLFYCLMISRKRAKALLAVAVLGLAVLALAPSSYTGRMQSIGSYDEDSSAQSRLILWRAAIDMSLDFPLGVGAGNFASAYGRYYSPVGDRSDHGSDVVWAPGRWLNAHSVYFKTLGEYGVIGFALMSALVILNVRDCLAARARSFALGSQAPVDPDWPGLLAMSICGYAICGIFLGGFSYPHMFLLSGLAVATRRLTEAPATQPARTSRTRIARPGGQYG